MSKTDIVYGTFAVDEDTLQKEIPLNSLGNKYKSTRSSKVVLIAVSLVLITGCYLVYIMCLSRLNDSYLNDDLTMLDNGNTDQLDTPVIVKATVYINRNNLERPILQVNTLDTAFGNAYGYFNDSMHQTGWSKLDITAKSKDNSYTSLCTSSFASGYLEGALTHHRIDQHYTNTYLAFFPDGNVPASISKFLNQNLDWMRQQVQVFTSRKNESLTDVNYWKAVGMVLSQLDGLVAGYQAHTCRTPKLSIVDLMLLNSDGDLEDLIPALNHTRTRQPGMRHWSKIKNVPYSELIKSLKCSALIRLIDNNTDLVWGHTTWDQYSAMNRIYKFYDIPAITLDSTQPRRRKVSMSSSPGYLASVDDWYLTDGGLAVMETTNGLYRDKLYDLIVPQNILTWIRSVVANSMATSGPEWTSVFTKYNSGTYNNQWMIIDLKQFQKGVGFLPNGLTILEQMPQFFAIADVSKLVNDLGYWASYNVPFFESVYNQTGFIDMYQSSNLSDSWSHSKCPRAAIFAREVPNIKNLEDLKRVMRFNDYKHDPLSKGHPANAISSRYDLESGKRFSLDGGIDTKVTSLANGIKLSCEAISGPTFVNNPVFTWNNRSLPNVSHLGQPTTFNFPFIIMSNWNSSFGDS